MILIADSSALVALSIVDKLDVLEKLFGDVYVIRATIIKWMHSHRDDGNEIKFQLLIKTEYNF